MFTTMPTHCCLCGNSCEAVVQSNYALRPEDVLPEHREQVLESYVCEVCRLAVQPHGDA